MKKSEFRIIAQKGKEGEWLPGLGGILYRLQRRISLPISWWLWRFIPKINPNMITTLAIIVVFLGFILMPYAKTFWHWILIGIIFYLSLILDKVDGELARAQNSRSYQGKYLDQMYHFAQCLLPTWLGFTLLLQYHDLYIAFIGINITIINLWINFRNELIMPAIDRWISEEREERFPKTRLKNIQHRNKLFLLQWIFSGLARFDGQVLLLLAGPVLDTLFQTYTLWSKLFLLFYLIIRIKRAISATYRDIKCDIQKCVNSRNG